MEPALNYCCTCGASVSRQIPAGDHLPRAVCTNCQTIHYRNPRIVAGVVSIWQEQVLLCRRAIEPRYGLWTLPAGFMENGESLEEACLRENQEETDSHIDLGELYSIISVRKYNQVHFFFRARLLDLEFHPGAETSDIVLFNEDDIPWQEIAFSSVTITLRNYFRDRDNSFFKLHSNSI